MYHIYFNTKVEKIFKTLSHCFKWRLLPAVVLMSLPTICTQTENSSEGLSRSDFRKVAYLVKMSSLTWLVAQESILSKK